MTRMLCCPAGHRWEQPSAVSLESDSSDCPVCGRPAQMLEFPSSHHTTVMLDDQPTLRLDPFGPFSDLPISVAAVLESHMEPRQYPAGEFLFRQGDAGSSLMVIREGTVEILMEDEPGEARLLARLGPGAVLGEMALLTSEPRSASARASNDVRVMTLAAPVFEELARENPAVSIVLTHLVASRLGGAEGDVLTGKIFHGYRIAGRLGRGGMAVVYEAEEVKSGRHVALKMMSHRLVYDELASEQFRQEADIIETLEHENIVRMFGRFNAFHTQFIVMEYCDGASLESVIRGKGRLPEEETRKIVGQVAAALEYAHAAGVAHRDVKPSNIVLTREGIVKLMDFGLAGPVEGGDQKFARLITGTPPYMAPEQWRGGCSDQAVDLWALGCVAYEMLTGQALFPPSGVGLGKPPLPVDSPHWPESVGITGEMAELLRQCLAREPEDRRVNLSHLRSWSAPTDPALLDEAG